MTLDKRSVEIAIAQLRSSFTSEGGDIHLVDVKEDGTVEVSLSGVCQDCEMSKMHLKMGVEQYLKQMVPGVREVITSEAKAV